MPKIKRLSNWVAGRDGALWRFRHHFRFDCRVHAQAFGVLLDGKLGQVNITHGFLAQDVERAAKEAGYDFSGVQKPANPDELYSLRYSDFVMPLVKAVQEQQKMIDDQKNAIDELRQQNMELQIQLVEIRKKLGIE